MLPPQAMREIIVLSNREGLNSTEVQDLAEFIQDMMKHFDGALMPLEDYYHMWSDSYE